VIFRRYVSNEDDPYSGRFAYHNEWRLLEIAQIAMLMVAKAFTIGRAALIACAITLSSTGQAQSRSGGVSAQAVAQATIMRPAILRNTGDVGRLESPAPSIEANRSIRPCVAAAPALCTLIVFDLP
jgi:hypothetical protein